MRSIEADVVVIGEISGFSGKPVCKYMCVYALFFCGIVVRFLWVSATPC